MGGLLCISLAPILKHLTSVGRVDPNQQHIVGGEFKRLAVLEFDRLAGPKVLALLRTLQPQLAQAQMEGMRGEAAVVGAVDDGNGQCAPGQVACPDLDLAFSIGASPLLALAILIDGDYIAIS